MINYVGMDLHSTNTYVGILDENEKRVFKGRFPNNLSVLLEVLKPFKKSTEGVVVESTFNWYWLVDGLMEEGYKVHLAHPPACIQYSGLKYSNDKQDAFFLARLLKLNILPTGYIFPKEERQLRDLLRKRSQLVRQRTLNILSFKSLVNRNTGISLNSNNIKMIKEDDIDTMFENKNLVLSAKSNIATIKYLNGGIKKINEKVLESARLKPEYELLLTVPGIGRVLALTISLETGNIKRFDSPGNYASYCRCVGSKRISNEKKKGENNRKNGNKYLAWAFVEAANFSKRFCPYAKAFYNRKLIKANNTLAIKALAHKISRACYHIMNDKVPYDVYKIFGKPINLDKGDGSKPKKGTGLRAKAPIGRTATPN